MKKTLPETRTTTTKTRHGKKREITENERIRAQGLMVYWINKSCKKENRGKGEEEINDKIT